MCPTIRIGNFVWLDTNANGIQDAGEPGIPGVSVSLLNKTTGAFISNTTTSAAGEYFFDIPLGSTSVTLAPGQGIDAELEATLGFSLPDNTYGTVEVTSTGDPVFAEVLRVRTLNGYIDLAEGIPVR